VRWVSIPALNSAGTSAATATRETPGFFAAPDPYRRVDGIRERDRECYLVEWYRSNLTEDDFEGHRRPARRMRGVQWSAQGAPVQVLMTLAVPADEVVFGVFVAGSADLVAQVCRLAGLAPQRLTATLDARIPGPD